MVSGSVILILLDGLGIGERGNPANPLNRFSPRVLRLFSDRLGPFPAGGRGLTTDVSSGVTGLPQSATNHVTLLTGVNGAAALGRHLSGFPNRFLRQLLEKHSVFRQLQSVGRSVTFANSYTPEFFQNRPRWVSASTVMCESAGVSLQNLEDVRAGRSLYMDITHFILRQKGYEVPLRSTDDAARILRNLAKNYDFCFFEYFLTDLAGHRGDLEQAEAILRTVDDFLFELCSNLTDNSSLLVTSDHGNLEDMSVGSHTHNPVATLVWGPLATQWASRSTLRLDQITPAIVNYLSSSPP